MSEVLVSQNEAIKTITLNGPRTKNAVTLKTEEDLLRAFQACQTDGTRVVILTGANGNFSSGAFLDPSHLLEDDFDITTILRTTANPLILAMRSCPVPIIASVRGVAVGIGFSLALACDMIYATPQTSFSMIFSRIGLSSDGGGSYFLQNLIGYHRAFELMVTGRMVSGREAADLGIINECLDDSELDDAVMKVCRQLARGPALSYKATKRNLRVAETGTLADTLESEAVEQGTTGRSKDFREGIMAFLEKRGAVFKGE